jgi:hypothetical protein
MRKRMRAKVSFPLLFLSKISGNSYFNEPGFHPTAKFVFLISLSILRFKLYYDANEL